MRALGVDYQRHRRARDRIGSLDPDGLVDQGRNEERVQGAPRIGRLAVDQEGVLGIKFGDGVTPEANHASLIVPVDPWP